MKQITCPDCGNKLDELLENRFWICKNCGTSALKESRFSQKIKDLLWWVIFLAASTALGVLAMLWLLGG